MSVQVGQVPTPQGISALLRKAGFSRSQRAGHSWYSPGYQVRKSAADSTAVYVEHAGGSGGMSREQRMAWAVKYAEVIRAAGWTVTGPEPGMWPQLTVTARPVLSLPGLED